MAIITETFVGDGSTKEFTVSSTMLSKSHVRVDLYYGSTGSKDDVDATDHLIPESQWDVLSATVLFDTAPANDYEVRITVSSDGTGLDTAPSVYTTVVSSITEILALSAIIDNILSVETIKAEIVSLDSIKIKLESLYADKATLDSLYADKATLDALFSIKIKLDSLYADKVTLDSLYSDKTKLDSIFADKIKLDSLYADKSKLDSLYADKETLDSLYADKTALDTIYANLSTIIGTQLVAWEAEASELTALSYAEEAEDVEVNVVTSDEDGTFTYTPQAGVYSAKHHRIKAATFNPANYYTKTESDNKYINKDINTLTAKTTPVDADEDVTADSEDGFALKKVSWANRKATLKTYFDTLYTKFQPTIATGSATFTNATNNIALTGIGIGVEIGDVLQVSGSTNNDTEFTVEVITDANNVIVNQAHAGKTTTKALVDETATVTVKLLAKWYNASDGLGQGWVNVKAVRALDTTYPNLTNRELKIAITGARTNVAADIIIYCDGEAITREQNDIGYSSAGQGDITRNSSYSINNGLTSITSWFERR